MVIFHVDGESKTEKCTCDQPLWSSTVSQDSAMSFTFLLVNSGSNCTTRANSVVQTGV